LICTLLNNVPHFFPTSKIYSQKKKIQREN
jgi:hypothetical protein